MNKDLSGTETLFLVLIVLGLAIGLNFLVWWFIVWAFSALGFITFAWKYIFGGMLGAIVVKMLFGGKR